jgi:hypothetical protein
MLVNEMRILLHLMWTSGAIAKKLWILILIQIWNLKSSVSDPDSIRPVDPEPGGQNFPSKIEKIKKFHV